MQLDNGHEQQTCRLIEELIEELPVTQCGESHLRVTPEALSIFQRQDSRFMVLPKVEPLVLRMGDSFILKTILQLCIELLRGSSIKGHNMMACWKHLTCNPPHGTAHSCTQPQAGWLTFEPSIFMTFHVNSLQIRLR